jgi:plastocyanin
MLRLSCLLSLVVAAACSGSEPAPDPDVSEPAAVEGLHGTAPAAVGGTPSVVLLRSPSAAAPAADSAVMDQLGLAFSPPELIVRVGQRVVFTNSEAFTHNIHIVTTDTDSVVLHADTDPNARAEFVFTAEGGYDVTCEEHPGMRAFIYATSAEHAVFAARDGRFSVSGIPDGAYTVSVWSVDPAQRADTTVGVQGST